MILEMKVPSPGESISEVEIAQWLVEDGDYVEKDQTIAEVDSDKATLDLPAEESGVITLKAEEGDAVLVGQVVCLIDTKATKPKKQTKKVNEVIIEEKSEKAAFDTIIRCVTSGPNKRQAEINMKSLANAFSQYSSPSLNGLTPHKFYSRRTFISHYLFRNFERFWTWKHHKLVLTPEELTSLFHFPHIKFNDIPGIKWQNYKIAKAPAGVPKDGILIGHNVYRGETTPIYLKNEDRFRHFYVIGQTGTGKSSIFQNRLKQHSMYIFSRVRRRFMPKIISTQI